MYGPSENHYGKLLLGMKTVHQYMAWLTLNAVWIWINSKFLAYSWSAYDRHVCFRMLD